MPTQLTIVFLKWILLHCFCISCGTENAKCLLIPVSEAETVVCFCSHMAPYSYLPPNSPIKRGLYIVRECTAWVCTYISNTGNPPHSLRCLLPLHSTPQYTQHSKQPNSIPGCARPFKVHWCWPLSSKTKPTPTNVCYRYCLKEIIANYRVYTMVGKTLLQQLSWNWCRTKKEKKEPWPFK